MYTDKVIEHFRDPKNRGKLEDFSAIGKVGNISCGDVMHVYIRVGTNEHGEEFIEDISWETFGCTAAIATSSVGSELAKGKTLAEATEITNQQISEELDGLPPIKMHCSNLAADALNEAIYAHLKNTGQDIPEVLSRRHEHIRGETEALEEKYATFVDEQEETAHS